MWLWLLLHRRGDLGGLGGGVCPGLSDRLEEFGDGLDQEVNSRGESGFFG